MFISWNINKKYKSISSEAQKRYVITELNNFVINHSESSHILYALFYMFNVHNMQHDKVICF